MCTLKSLHKNYNFFFNLGGSIRNTACVLEGWGEIGGTCVNSAGKICFYEINSKMEDTTCGGVIPCISLVCILRSYNTCDIEHGSEFHNNLRKDVDIHG